MLSESGLMEEVGGITGQILPLRRYVIPYVRVHVQRWYVLRPYQDCCCPVLPLSGSVLYVAQGRRHCDDESWVLIKLPLKGYENFTWGHQLQKEHSTFSSDLFELLRCVYVLR